MRGKHSRIRTVAVSKRFWLAVILFGTVAYILTAQAHDTLMRQYEAQQSVEIRDRNGEVIARKPNPRGHYADTDADVPPRAKELIIQKEDRFFYYHPGFNPISMGRAAFRYATRGYPGGSSTITQQLVKILLGNENERTVANKLLESFYVASLELHAHKDDILRMYANTVYMGNQAQGITEASRVYFNKEPHELTDQETVTLLSTISSPSLQNPWEKKNIPATKALADRLGVSLVEALGAGKKSHSYRMPALFELSSLGLSCKKSCDTTIDFNLTKRIREILRRNISYSYARGVRNGAVVVIKLTENELLAVVGSPNPTATRDGSQINMAIEPRPIGSTIKPFIYLEGFKRGLRPYSRVDDREYKYPVATGYPIYPKNFDGTYRGIVSLHEALSNSLNVPTVKVLEYIGPERFYDFLEHTLGFEPIQPLDTYGLGIALGGLETDLLTLAHLFTVFPQEGELLPLSLVQNGSLSRPLPPRARITSPVRIAEEKYVALVNRILSDRKTGVEQFGQKSSLNLSQDNYAVKTGTSRDFHDSWVIGYTPDFLVGVWIGNSENRPLEQVTGQTGAGQIWQEVMELLLSSSYNKQTPFDFSLTADIQTESTIEFGLPTDIYDEHVSLLLGDVLITEPHHGDVFEFETGMAIPLQATEESIWRANGQVVGSGKDVLFEPQKIGGYEIEARGADRHREIVRIEIVAPR